MSGIDKTGRVVTKDRAGLQRSACSRRQRPGLTPNGLGKSSAERSLIREATLKCHVHQRVSGCSHQVLRQLDPPLHQPTMRRDAECRPERSCKMADRHPALPCKRVQPHATIEPGSQHFGSPPRLPRGQPARHHLGQAGKPAIGLQDMRAEHQAELIDREQARPISRCRERQDVFRQLRDDQIILADPELEVLYWLDLMIARDFIQALARHVVMDIVECAIERAQERRF